MAATKNVLDAFERINELRIRDSVSLARRVKSPDIPKSWPKMPDLRGIDEAGYRMMKKLLRSTPDDPREWQKRCVQDYLDQPRTRHIYWVMRRNLWLWPEFISLRPKARQILELVIELAREEAFPWYLNVQAREVLRLARTNHATMAESIRELQCFVITRPARRIRLLNPEPYDTPIIRSITIPDWPSKENNFGVDPNEPVDEIPQWVVRYRRGVPKNANRAAWWINYDLFCETQRVLPCFEVSVDTLEKTYESRNQRLGTEPGFKSEDAFKAHERALAKRGPKPPTGLRAPLWEAIECGS